MDDTKYIELRQASQSLSWVFLGERVHDFLKQSCIGERRKNFSSPVNKLVRSLAESESKALLKSDGPPHACGVIHKALVVQHADGSGFQVTQPPMVVNQLSKVFRVEADSESINREVPAGQI